jgi:hypothetical protein
VTVARRCKKFRALLREMEKHAGGRPIAMIDQAIIE